MYCFADSLELCETLLAGGARIVQLRAKSIGDTEFRQLAAAMQDMIRLRYPEAALIINDRVDIALEIGADGIHVGQDDLDFRVVIERARPQMIVGVSARTVEQAVAARQAGASYIGAGAVFATRTKSDARVIGVETLREIVAAIDIPVVAIGGISLDNVDLVVDAGADFIAVISAVNDAEDIGIRLKEFERRLGDLPARSSI